MRRVVWWLALAGCGAIPYIPSAPSPIGEVGDTGLPDIGCSPISAGPDASLTIVNGYADVGLDLMWVDWDCVEQHLVHLDPGQEGTVGTYIDHVWIIRNAESDAYIDGWVVTEREQTRTYAP